MSALITADPRGARDHARSMAGRRAEAMPTVPATDAFDLPSHISPGEVIWDETIAAGGYAARQMDRGARLRLADLRGDACASMLVFNAERPVERLNVADTVKVQWNAYLGAGGLILSDMGRVLFSILESDAGPPDAFCGASNLRSNTRRYGDGFNHGAHPNARDRFAIALAKYGLGRKDIHPCLNWFKAVRIEADGAVAMDAGPFAPGRSITLRAEMDVIVVLANCPHVLDPRAEYSVTPLRATAWRGPQTAADDPIRTATPEGLRAFLNVEDYYRR
jgi:urea carboxylase-associated protein 2